MNWQELRKLKGKRITLFCLNYIYTGKLEEVDDSSVKLSDAAIVYETGDLTRSTKWKDAQALPGDWYVALASIESFGIMK